MIGPISAEFGVLVHNGTPYPKDYKSTKIGNTTANMNTKCNSLSLMLTVTDQKQ